MFNTLSTPFSLMDSVDIIHLKIGRAPLPTVYGWNGTVCIDGCTKGSPLNMEPAQHLFNRDDWNYHGRNSMPSL